MCPVIAGRGAKTGQHQQRISRLLCAADSHGQGERCNAYGRRAWHSAHLKRTCRDGIAPRYVRLRSVMFGYVRLCSVMFGYVRLRPPGPAGCPRLLTFLGSVAKTFVPRSIVEALHRVMWRFHICQRDVCFKMLLLKNSPERLLRPDFARRPGIDPTPVSAPSSTPD